MWQGSLENTNRFKDIRYNSYFHKANPPAHMMTDVMHFGIHDSAFNGLAGRKCSSILRRLHGPGHVTLVILGSLNVASMETCIRGDSQTLARIYWVQATGKAWCEVCEGTRNRLHCSCFGRSLQIVLRNKTHTLRWMTPEGFCGYFFLKMFIYFCCAASLWLCLDFLCLRGAVLLLTATAWLLIAAASLSVEHSL